MTQVNMMLMVLEIQQGFMHLRANVSFHCNRCKWVSERVEAYMFSVSIPAFFLCLPIMCFGVIEAISMSDIVCASMIWGQRCSVQARQCPWRNSGTASQSLHLFRIDSFWIKWTVYLIKYIVFTVQPNHKVRASSWVWLLKQRSCVVSDKRITDILHGWFDSNTLNNHEYNPRHLNA